MKWLCHALLWGISVKSISHGEGRQMSRLFRPSFRLAASLSLALCVCVCVRARARLRACMCDLRKGRKSNWGAGFDCGTSIVDPCILLLNSHSSYTHTHTHTNTRLIDQIDLHMSDGANFSPFPPLANLWPLIYTRLNLYTLIMLLCSLALSLFTHARSQVFCVVYNAAH